MSDLHMNAGNGLPKGSMSLVRYSGPCNRAGIMIISIFNDLLNVFSTHSCVLNGKWDLGILRELECSDDIIRVPDINLKFCLSSLGQRDSKRGLT